MGGGGYFYIDKEGKISKLMLNAHSLIPPTHTPRFSNPRIDTEKEP